MNQTPQPTPEIPSHYQQAADRVMKEYIESMGAEHITQLGELRVDMEYKKVDEFGKHTKEMVSEFKTCMREGKDQMQEFRTGFDEIQRELWKPVQIFQQKVNELNLAQIEIQKMDHEIAKEISLKFMGWNLVASIVIALTVFWTMGRRADSESLVYRQAETWKTFESRIEPKLSPTARQEIARGWDKLQNK